MTTFVAFLVEAFGTGVLAFVIFALTNQRNSVMQGSGFVPPLIGMTVGALIAVLAPLTQGGYNPGMFGLSASLTVKCYRKRHGTYHFCRVHHSVYFLDDPPKRSTRLWTTYCRIFGWLEDGGVSGMVGICDRTCSRGDDGSIPGRESLVCGRIS